MKHPILFLSLSLLALFAQAQENTQEELLGDVVAKNALPTSFNYQALIYQEGKPVQEKDVTLQVTLQDEAQTVYYTEELTVKTAKSGLVNITVGTEGATVTKGSMSVVPWEKGIYVAAAVRLAGASDFVSLGPAVKMQAVPYALYARAVPVVRGTKEGREAGRPIFQVQSSEGLPLFSVYDEAVTINVPMSDETRRPRGGFAVRSFKMSTRAEKPTYAWTERFAINDGAFRVFVDPEGEQTRRPRGGFAVMTRNSFRGQDPTTEPANKLFQISERETYFTIDRCDLGSTFQFRDRCANDKVVMNITGEGRIETANKKEDVLKKLVDVPTNEKLKVNWPWPASYAYNPEENKFGFTNLIRWRAPLLKSETSPNDKINFKIQVVDDPTDTRKLSDFVKAGTFITTADGVVEREGVMLAPGYKLTPDFVFPKGKLKITTTNLVKNQELEFTIPENLKMIREDKLKLDFWQCATSVGDSTFTFEDTYIDEVLRGYQPRKLDGTPDGGPQVTDSMSVEDFLINTEWTPSMEGEYAECFKLERKIDQHYGLPMIRLTLVKPDEFKRKISKLPPAPTGWHKHNLPVKIKISFPSGVFEDITLERQYIFLFEN